MANLMTIIMFIVLMMVLITVIAVISVRMVISAGTRQLGSRRLIEYLKEATRSARHGSRSVLGADGKVQI